MKSKIVTFFVLIVSALLVSGCGGSEGNEGNEGEVALELQYFLDEGKYGSVISLLEGKAQTKNQKIALGAAYIGRAGFSISKIIEVIASSANDTNGSATSTLISNLSSKGSATALSDLTSGKRYYNEVVSAELCADENQTKTIPQTDLCFFSGLASMARLATTMGYLGNIESVFEQDGTEDIKMKASTCAMRYAFEDENLSDDCDITSDGNVTFVQSNTTYEAISVNSAFEDGTYDYLITYDTVRSSVVTSGYCRLNDFSTRTDILTRTVARASGYYVCPLKETVESEELTVNNLIVDALNGDLDAVGAMSSSSQEDIDQLRADILEANGRNITDENTTITAEDVAKYLDLQNQ